MGNIVEKDECSVVRGVEKTISSAIAFVLRFGFFSSWSMGRGMQ